ncbi:hypothetical protein MPER_04128 [Moniliophthora perniciosa FA553]|nr:hypothetical protein MPER_04128 [Moniliophthora perniciosa FA553]
MEALAGYLLYRLNVLNPISPAYLKLLPEGTFPTTDLETFLGALAGRMGMVKRGAEPDLLRAASYFVRWWREEGGLLAASSALQLSDKNIRSLEGSITQGWGFDFQWEVSPQESGDWNQPYVQRKMEECIEDYISESKREDRDESNVSATQRKKQLSIEEKAKRKLKHLHR